MSRPFTGRDMTMVLVAGFGVVAAVNFFMAGLATTGFGGVVVENSYVASQKFNGWLENAEKSRALGWQVDVSRDDFGQLIIETQGVPEGALVSAQLRRPLGEQETASLTFKGMNDGTYQSHEKIADGRWTARIAIASGEARWAGEVPLL